MEVGSSMFASLVAANTGLELDVSYKYTQFRFPFWGLVLYLLSIHWTQPISNKPRSGQSKYERKFGKTEAVMFIHSFTLSFSLLLSCSFGIIG